MRTRNVRSRVRERCDRCGRFTQQHGDAGNALYCLPHEYAAPLTDQGCFCMRCCEEFDEANWRAWFWANRPESFSATPMARCDHDPA